MVATDCHVIDGEKTGADSRDEAKHTGRTYTSLTALFRDYPGEPVPER